MKVWEETWTLSEDGIELPDHHGWPGPTVRGPWSSEEQARLAAAAPDLARVLLAVEWSLQAQTDDDWIDTCPVCCEPSFIGHAPDCALDAALRKAGVR